MDKRILTLSGLLLFSSLSWAVTSIYCPKKGGFIRVGMTMAEVTSACGQPTSQQVSDTPVTVQVPVTQLIYDNMNATKSFSEVSAFWTLPLGIQTNGLLPTHGGVAGTQGAKLQIDLVNGKVSAVELNSSGAGAFSICNGKSIKVGDPQNLVYAYCGSPSMTNQSMTTIQIPSSTKPEIWTYQAGQYDPSISLTFIDGKLQFIH